MKKEYIIIQKPNRPPIHPGSVLKEDILPALDLTITEAAKQLHVTRQTLHRIMAEETSITPEMALRLAKFCGNTPSLWLRMQQEYDLWFAKARLKDELESIPSHATTFHP